MVEIHESAKSPEWTSGYMAGLDAYASEVRAAQERGLLSSPDWRPIASAPLGDDDFYLVCCDDPRDERSPFVVRGSIFKSARMHAPSSHLSLAHLTHWMPLPAKPQRTPLRNAISGSDAAEDDD